jgi:[ribosomal protein S18]-alanine N-acetyltransferase
LLIRPAVVDDIPHMVDLERQCATAAHWSPDQYRAAVGTDSFESQRLVLVVCSHAEQNDSSDPGESSALLAFLVAHFVGAEWEVENVVVTPVVRRQGVGVKLLDEIISRARQADADAVFLEVRESNHAARALYEKASFAQVGRRKGYYSEPPEDAIVYRLAWTSDRGL